MERNADRSEKIEGRRNLVKDSIKLTTGDNGEAVIEQKGEATYYGSRFQGRTTAAGDLFDQHGLTAAHPTLPMGTEATVTNLDTGQSVEVEINDRGPHARGRDIDLSKGAAAAIGLDEEGAIPVKIEAELPPL